MRSQGDCGVLPTGEPTPLSTQSNLIRTLVSPQAEGRHEEIRTSFDEPTAPLLENAAERGEINAGESGFDGYEPE